MVGISLGLSYLWFAHLLKAVGSPNLGNFYLLFPQILLHVYSPSLFTLGFWWHKCWIFCYCPKGCWVSDFFSFFSVYFSQLFRLGKFYWSVLKFTVSFFIHFHSTICAHSESFLFVTIFLSSIISIWFLFIPTLFD